MKSLTAVEVYIGFSLSQDGILCKAWVAEGAPLYNWSMPEKLGQNFCVPELLIGGLPTVVVPPILLPKELDVVCAPLNPPGMKLDPEDPGLSLSCLLRQVISCSLLTSLSYASVSLDFSV